jgi:hypothetical protein
MPDDKPRIKGLTGWLRVNREHGDPALVAEVEAALDSGDLYRQRKLYGSKIAPEQEREWERRSAWIWSHVR